MLTQSQSEDLIALNLLLFVIIDRQLYLINNCFINEYVVLIKPSKNMLKY